MKGNGIMRVLEIVLDEKAAAAREIWPEAEVEVVKVAGRGGEPGLLPRRAKRGGFDVVLAAHVLQSVPRAEVVETLRHWANTLGPAGELHIIVPDLQWACEQVSQSHEVDKLVLSAIYGGQGEAWAYHRTGFTVAGLRGALSGADLAAQQARLGPYRIGDETGEVIARQVYVVAVRRENRKGQEG